MPEKEINITYETIFDLLRRERNRADLQKLNDTFFEDVRSYLNEKSRIIDSAVEKPVSDAEKERTLKQIENTRQMLRSLFERRQQKIIQMAVMSSRNPADTGGHASLLDSEKEMIEGVILIIKKFRQQILSQISISSTQKQQKPEIKQEIKPAEAEKEHKTQLESEAKKNEPFSAEKTKVVRFLSSMPQFLGKGLEIYGPFEEDDVASLPEEIAAILIKKARAEEIKHKNF